MKEVNNTRAFSRRHFLGMAGGAAAVTLVGCGDEKSKPAPTSLPTSKIQGPAAPAVEPTNVALTEASYRAFSPKEKLTILESRGLSAKAYPEIQGFSPERELTLAVVDAYAQVTPLIKSKEEMANSVSFDTKETYLDQLGIELKKTLSPQERQKEYETRPEFVSSDRVVHMNRDKINEIVQTVSTQETAKKFSSNQLSVKIYEAILFHAITHANNQSGTVNIDPFSMSLPGGQGANFTELSGFDIIGSDQNGSPFFIHGTNEAVTEFIARNVNIKATGVHLSPVSDGYLFGANMIGQINQRAGISVEEFYTYNSSDQTAKLLSKWGSIKNPSTPDKKSATMAFAAIGLGVAGVIKTSDALGFVNQLLTPANPIH